MKKLRVDNLAAFTLMSFILEYLSKRIKTENKEYKNTNKNNLEKAKRERVVSNRCLILGAPKVGKTAFVAIANRANVPIHFLPSIWTRESTVSIHASDGEVHELKLNDSVGMENSYDLSDLPKHTIQLFGVCLLCFSVENHESFNLIKNTFFYYINGFGIPAIIVACKSDLLSKNDYFINPGNIDALMNEQLLNKYCCTINKLFKKLGMENIFEIFLPFCNWSNLTLIQEEQVQKLCENLNARDYVMISSKKNKNIQQCLKIALENLKPVKIHRRTMSNIHEKNDSPRSIRSRSMFSGWSSKAEIIPFIE